METLDPAILAPLRRGCQSYSESMILRLATLLAISALGPVVQAYVLIDDFAVGEYHSVITWPNNHDGHELSGLDKAHSVFGKRGADVIVNTNFDKVPVFIDFGRGQARISYDSPSGDIATDTLILFGNTFGVNIDFSAETEFWIDLSTENPPNRLADQWTLTVADRFGHVDTNPGWLHRPGGIRFRKQDFDSTIDWTVINNITFEQRFSPDTGEFQAHIQSLELRQFLSRGRPPSWRPCCSALGLLRGGDVELGREPAAGASILVEHELAHAVSYDKHAHAARKRAVTQTST